MKERQVLEKCLCRFQIENSNVIFLYLKSFHERPSPEVTRSLSGSLLHSGKPLWHLAKNAFRSKRVHEMEAKLDQSLCHVIPTKYTETDRQTFSLILETGSNEPYYKFEDIKRYFPHHCSICMCDTLNKYRPKIRRKTIFLNQNTCFWQSVIWVPRHHICRSSWIGQTENSFAFLSLYNSSILSTSGCQIPRKIRLHIFSIGGKSYTAQNWSSQLHHVSNT